MAEDLFGTIASLENLYCVAVDTHRWELLDEIFAPDIHLAYTDSIYWTDLASLKRDFAANHRSSSTTTQHVISNVAWRRHGGIVRVICYAYWLMIHPGMAGGEIFEARGWYEDELAERPEGWRIRHRTAGVIRWTGNLAIMTGSPDRGYSSAVESLLSRASERRLPFLDGVS